MKSKEKPPSLKIGVTGGIGSGKSTACKMFDDLGRYVIMADDVARKLADESPAIQKAIKHAFGAEAYLASGLLDRKKMASIVFNDPKKRATLDSIIHPHVFDAVDHQLRTLSSAQSHPYVIIEAALIYETGMDETMDYIIVVSADEEACIQRVVERDHISRNDVLLRITAQMPMTQKIKKADFVLHNNGIMDEMRSTIKFLDTMFTQLVTGPL